MKNVISLFVLFLLLFQFSCKKEEEDPINQDVDLTLLYEEDFTSGIHKVFNQNNWPVNFTDEGAVVSVGGTGNAGLALVPLYSTLQTPDDLTYGASVTFSFSATTGTGAFGFIFTGNGGLGGTSIMVSKAGYALLHDARGRSTPVLSRLGSGGLFYVGHLMDADGDINLSMAVNKKYIAYYVNGHKVYEQASFIPAGRACGFSYYPPVSVNVKKFSTYD